MHLYHDVDFHSVRNHAETDLRPRLRQSDAFQCRNFCIMGTHVRVLLLVRRPFCHLVKLLRSSMTQDARDVLSHELRALAGSTLRGLTGAALGAGLRQLNTEQLQSLGQWLIAFVSIQRVREVLFKHTCSQDLGSAAAEGLHSSAYCSIWPAWLSICRTVLLAMAFRSSNNRRCISVSLAK